MRRGLLFIFALLFCCSICPARSFAQAENKVLGKTVGEWIDILHTAKKVKHRRAAVIIMGTFGAAERGVVGALILSVKKDPEETIREAAALLLGSMGRPAKSAVGTLEESLAKDKSPKVRKAAARALGDEMLEYSKRSIVTLGEALNDKDAGVRSAAALTLKQHGGDARDARRYLLAAAKNPKMDRYTRMYCAQILSTFSDDGDIVAPLLVSMLSEKGLDNTMLQVVVDGLANFGKKSAPAMGRLLEIFTDKKAPILLRRSAAVTLVKVEADGKKVWPAAKKMMLSTKNEIRSQAVRLAAKLCRGETELLPSLIERCRDENQEVQRAAVQELGLMGKDAKKADGVIAQLAVNAPRRAIREAARLALKQIRGEVKIDE